MSAPSYLSNPSLLRIPALLREVYAGNMRVPRFQRPFIWKPEQRLELFDSIYRGEPIGSILVWRTSKQELPCYTWHGPAVVFEARAESAPEYVLDGHQRLNTLYHGLSAGLIASIEEETNAYDEPVSGQGEVPEGGPVFFDLEKREFSLWKPRGDPPLSWLPMAFVFDAYRMDEYRATLRDQKNPSKQREWYRLTQKVSSQFTDYTIPVIPLVTEDQEHAIRSFSRINSGGTPVSEAHFLSALTWTRHFDLNEGLEEVRSALREAGWGDIKLDVMVRTGKALLGKELYQNDQDVVSAFKKRPAIVDDIKGALSRLVDFLAETPEPRQNVVTPARIMGPGVLPYDLQAVFLADALQTDASPALHGEPVARLREWLWITSLGEYFYSVKYRQLRRTTAHLVDVLAGNTEPAPEDLDSPIVWKPRFDFRSGRSRFLCLLMAGLGPRDTDDKAVSADMLLAQLGREAAVRLFTKRELGTGTSAKDRADSPGNRILVDPRQSGKLKRRLQRQPDTLTPGFWLSHGFNDQARDAVLRGDWTDAINERNAVLEHVECTFAESLGIEYERSTSRASRFDAFLRQALAP
ncbi:MAG: DUF262 domain-containing protein [Proteobacteria bacterium]|nr:DUF262 domain-containing protein [Pseudomonadota bacterium]